MTSKPKPGFRIGVLLPEPHVMTGGNQTLLDFAAAAGKLHSVSLLYVRPCSQREMNRAFLETVSNRIGRETRIVWMARVIDSNLLPGIRLSQVLMGERRWTTLRFLVGWQRFVARRHLAKLTVVITSQYVSQDGIQRIKELSGAQVVLNHAGDPVTLERSWLSSFGPGGLEGEAVTRSYAEYLGLFDHILFQTRQHESLFLERIPSLRGRTATVRPSVDTTDFGRPHSTHPPGLCPLRPQGSEAFLCVGKIGMKGQDLALEAFATIAPDYPSWDLHFVGSTTSNPPFSEKLTQRVSELGLSARVFFHGHQENLAQYIQCASALVLASESEGAPRVVREAMYARLPVVAVPIAGVTEMVDSNSAFLAVVRTRAGLADALRAAAKSEQFRNKIAAAARTRFDRKMSSRSYSASVLRFLDRIVQAN